MAHFTGKNALSGPQEWSETDRSPVAWRTVGRPSGGPRGQPLHGRYSHSVELRLDDASHTTLGVYALAIGIRVTVTSL